MYHPVSLVVSLTLVNEFSENALHDFYGDSSVGVSASLVRGRHRVRAAEGVVVVAVGQGTAVARESFAAIAWDRHSRVWRWRGGEIDVGIGEGVYGRTVCFQGDYGCRCCYRRYYGSLGWRGQKSNARQDHGVPENHGTTPRQEWMVRRGIPWLQPIGIYILRFRC